jgi:MFS family permease
MLNLSALRTRDGSIYAGWWVIGACCLLAVFPGAIFSYGFPVFFLSIERDLMISRAQVSLIFALSRGEAGIGGPLVGWMIDQFDSRPIIIVFGLMAGVGLIILSDVSNYWLFVLIYVGVVSVGNNSGFGQVFLAVANRWFVRRRAMGMTLIITSYTIGGAFMLPVLSRGVDALGWREVMLYSGIFVAAIVVPVALFIRRSPEHVGISLEHAGEAIDPTSAEAAATQQTGRDYTVREALKTPTYWFILVGSSLRIAVTSGVLVHGIPIMVWKGTTEQTGADLIGLLFFVSIPARFLIGMSGLKLPGNLVLAAGMGAGAVSLLALNYVEGTWIIYFFVLGLAFLEGASVLNWVLLGNIFGRRNFATLTGIISIFYSAGMMLSPLFLGWMFDRSGSYAVSLAVLIILYGVSAILFIMARAPKEPAPAAAAV